MGRTKVFVGNLSFKTTETDLAKEFEAAGKVANASIISRGARSLGYGFVEMESEEEAQKSVELLNKKLIDNREINVEIARPQKPQDPNNAPAAGGNAPNAGGAAGAAGDATRGRRPFRGRRPRRGPKEGGNANNGTPAAEGSAPANGAPAGEGAAPQRRGPRAPRAPKPDADKTPRTPSKDTLFVTNLPFSVDDDGLSAIFQGMNIKAAHVVRKHNNRSKGFGFVEFNNAEDQQKALTAVDKKNVEGRELVVKVALTEAARAAAAAGAPGSPGLVPAAAATPAAGAESK